MEPYQVAILTLAAVVVVKLLILFVLGGGSLARFGTAYSAFRRIMGDPEAARKVAEVFTPKPPEPPKPVKLSGEPLRLLIILQREGRLLDFLLEDISGAPDDLVGAGVRELHKKSQAVIREHLTLEPVLTGQEESPVDVPAGFDPSAIRLTGNVTGNPPFKGVLKHHGWRVKAYKLPAPPAGVDELVVMPAEVELP